jgi:retron-type reverse transcriptase
MPIDYQSLEMLVEEENITGIGTLFINLDYSLEDVEKEFGDSSRELQHYERYLANQEIINKPETPEKPKGRRKPNGIGFNIDGYKHAERILNWPTNYRSLKLLVYDVTGDGDFANSLDEKGLRHQYHRISGLAKTILSNRKQ